jgi:carboxymethylenebutenolidase
MAFRPYLIEEITRDCVAGALTRREALRRLGLLGVSAATASALLAAGSNAAGASTLPPTDTAPDTAPGSTEPLAEGEEIVFPGPAGDLFGAYSAADEPQGAVLVIHENRGLTPHIRTIPPRLAADGYSALAIDLLSAEGGTDSLSEGDAQAALGNAPPETARRRHARRPRRAGAPGPGGRLGGHRLLHGRGDDVVAARCRRRTDPGSRAVLRSAP